jgi:hypothetical protein
MKKIILLLGMLMMTGGAAFAQCDYECVAPYDLNNKARAILSTITGANWLVENRIESILKKEVLKIASADNLKIKVDSYSPKDLKNGIFKSMEVTGNNVEINKIYLDSLSLKTLCDFNYIRQSGKEIVFVEAMPLSFNLTMSSENINKTVQNDRYKKIVKDLNKLVTSYGFGLEISSTKVSIKNNKFYYVMGFEIPFVSKEQRIVVQADLRVKDGKIDFNNTQLVSNKFNLNLKRLDFILNYLNPLEFSVNIFDNKDAKVNVKNVEIVDNVIHADGTIVVPKD